MDFTGDAMPEDQDGNGENAAPASSAAAPGDSADDSLSVAASSVIAPEDLVVPFDVLSEDEWYEIVDDGGEEDVDPAGNPFAEADAAHARLCRDLLKSLDDATFPLQAVPGALKVVVEVAVAFARAVESPSTMDKGIFQVAEGSPEAALILVAAVAKLTGVVSAREDRAMLDAETLLIEAAAAQLRQVPAPDPQVVPDPQVAAGDAASASTEDAPAMSDAADDAPALSAKELTRAQRGARTQIAIARRASHEKTSRDITTARRVADYLPKLQQAKLSGRLTGATVAAIAGSITDIDPELSGIVDDTLAHDDYEQIEGRGTNTVRSITQGIIAANMDEKTARDRAFLAARDRYVKITPADDGMARLTAMLPAFMAAQINATLQAAAESARAAGSQIAPGALRADALGEAVNFFHDAAAYLPEIDNENLASRAIMRGMIDHDRIVNRPVTGIEATTAPPPAIMDISELYAQYDPNYGPDEEFFDDDVDDATGLPSSQTRAQARARAQMQGTFDALRYAYLLDQAAGAIGAFGPFGAAHGINPARAGQRVFTPGKRSHGPKVQVCVIIQDTALLGRPDGAEMAHLSGYGTLPAHHIRAHFAGEDPRFTAPRLGMDPEKLALDAAAVAELQRIYTYPGSGEIQAVESRSRAFRSSVRSIVLARDAISSAPYSNAASNQVDHIQPYADGGPTSIHNAQGLDASSNYVKEEGDWTTKHVGDPESPAGTRIEWTNPFGLTATVKTRRLHPPHPAYDDIYSDTPTADEDDDPAA